MSHPGPLLTDYVDGTLPPDRQAEVEAHLQTCRTCRDEVTQAQAGWSAATSLSTPAAPARLADAALAEAARHVTAAAPQVRTLPTGTNRSRPTPSRWVVVAGVAAVVAILALVVPKLGQPSGSLALSSGAAGAADVAFPAASVVELQRTNYGADLVQQVAATFAQDDATALARAASASTSAPEAAIPSLAGSDAAYATSAQRLPAVTHCLDKAYDNQGAQLTRAIAARYEGRPAYLGVYLQGPGAGLPPVRVLVVVAAIRGCAPLATGTVALP